MTAFILGLTIGGSAGYIACALLGAGSDADTIEDKLEGRK